LSTQFASQFFREVLSQFSQGVRMCQRLKRFDICCQMASVGERTFKKFRHSGLHVMHPTTFRMRSKCKQSQSRFTVSTLGANDALFATNCFSVNTKDQFHQPSNYLSQPEHHFSGRNLGPIQFNGLIPRAFHSDLSLEPDD